MRIAFKNREVVFVAALQEGRSQALRIKAQLRRRPNIQTTDKRTTPFSRTAAQDILELNHTFLIGGVKGISPSLLIWWEGGNDVA